jgi:hypothetical protein
LINYDLRVPIVTMPMSPNKIGIRLRIPALNELVDFGDCVACHPINVALLINCKPKDLPGLTRNVNRQDYGERTSK